MQDNPLVTVIALCFNHENFVIESLNSVIHQTYKNIELIIVDDGSSDLSKQQIENWLLLHPDATLISNPTNQGNTKSFNNALKIANGSYILDLATDDVLEHNCIALQLQAFLNSTFKNLGAVYGNAELINADGTFHSYFFKVDQNKKTLSKRTTGNIYQSVLTGLDSICSVSALFKKSVYDDLNGYDETLAYEDLDFWIRASRIYNFDYIDAVLIKKRILKNAMSSKFFSKNQRINQSTHQILKKSLRLNQNRDEDQALQKRIHYEIILSFNNRDFILLLKNISLRFQLSWRKKFHSYR